MAKSTKKPKKPIFVIHKHAARHLHYDLRLEIEGVLKSWAVPKEPTNDPKKRNLAIQVADHELEYAKFQGCFEFYTKVLTEKGAMNIGNIVNSKKKINVLSYNHLKKQLEWKPVIGWYKNGRTIDFIRIRVPGQRGGRRVITVTPNHQVYTPDGIKLAKDLVVGDSVLIPGKDWTIAKYLNDEWEIGAKVYYQKPRKKSGGGYYIHLSKWGSIRFLTLVNDYILPSLRYKTFIKKFKNKWIFHDNEKENVVPAKIIKIEKATKKKIRSQQKFDIQVKDNNNYFAGSMLVSNSIPEGQYGAGKVDIWDSGKYDLIEKEKDKIEFNLHGKKLKGIFYLIRFKKAGEKAWLFFKGKE